MTAAEDQIADRLHRARTASFLAPVGEPSAPHNDPGLDALIDRAAAIYSQAISDSTRITYARRWKTIQAWCTAQNLESLPMAPEVLLLYLTSQIDSDSISLNTVRGITSAVRRVHLESGLPAPNTSPLVYQFMRGLARGTTARAAHPMNTDALRISDLRRICRYLDSLMIDPRAARDAAILTLHALGAGDGQISRLNWPDLNVEDDRAEIRLVSARGGPGTTLTIDPSTESGRDALETLLTWREIATEDHAPMFSHIEPSGYRSSEALTARGIFKARHSRTGSLGMDGKPATVPEAIKLLSGPPSEVLRDRALLLVGWAMASRRPEAVGLRVSDVRWRTNGVEVHIRQTKTDLTGRGQTVGIPQGRSSATDPVAALSAWQARLSEQLGDLDGERLLFTHVGRSGRITNTPLSPEGLTRMVARRAQEAGCVGHFGGRSLRSGFISTAADLEIPIESIARQSRHKTLSTLILYIRNQDPLRGSPAGQVGL